MSTSIKFLINGEVRRVSIPVKKETLTFAAIVQVVQDINASMKEKKFTLLWQDEEGDNITVASDYELREAINVMSAAGILRFTVKEETIVNATPESATFASNLPPVQHHHVRCDECGLCPIVGIRFKCTVRDDFDLCAACEAKGPQPYPMVKITDPTQSPATLVYAFREEEKGKETPRGWPACRRGGHRFGGPHGPHGHPQGPPFGAPHQGPPPFGAPHQHPPQGRPQHGPPPFGCPPHQGPPHHGPPHHGPPHQGPPHHGPPHQGPPPCGRKFGHGGRAATWQGPGKFVEALDNFLFGPPKSEESKTGVAVAEAVGDEVDMQEAIAESLNINENEKPLYKDTVPPSNPTLPKPALRFVRDVSFPDKSPVSANSIFVKTWRVRNDGAFAWPEGSVLVPAGGDLMTASDFKEKLPVVAPNEEINLSVSLSAPAIPGMYTSYFRAQTKEEQNFGQRMWASVVVVEKEEEEWELTSKLESVAMEAALELSTPTANAEPTAPVQDTTAAPAPIEEPAIKGVEVVPEKQPITLLWKRELEVLSDMGFSSLEVNVPLLQKHLVSPVSVTGGAIDSEAMQRVVISLLSLY